MSANGISSLFDSLGSFDSMSLLKKKKGLVDETSLEELAVANLTNAIDSDPAKSNAQVQNANSTNMMNSNFVNLNSEESKYTKARKKSSVAVNNLQNSQDNLMAQLTKYNATANSGESRYTTATRTALRVSRLLRQEMSAQVLEKAEGHLKTSKDQIEQDAQNALAPKDADGNPIVSQATSSPVATTEAVNLAPVPDITNDTTSVISSDTAGDATSVAAPIATPQIDIIV